MDHGQNNVPLDSLNKVFRKFRTGDVPGNVSKGEPDFCTVYVINKGKISSVKSASGPHRLQKLPFKLKCQAGSETCLIQSIPERLTCTLQGLQEDMEIKDYPHINERTNLIITETGHHSLEEVDSPDMNPFQEDSLLHRGNSPPLSWQLRSQIAAENGTGLLFLHQTKPEPLVLRDLKPGNILLECNYVSKIGDVGLARLVPPSVANTVTQHRMTSTAGTIC
ncbi:U-box domain-containing protein 34-like [Populus alba x Populus x berolinensis]|nr:U-box domain-containing protein 34-like [Populus alba x Populus x berolinensis]